MNTQIILYSQQLFSNPRFANSQTFYGWDITGTWTKSTGKITKSGGSAGAIRQDDILIIGAEYRLRFTVTDRTAGNIFVMCKSGGNVLQNVNSNTTFDITFTADGEDIIFDCNSAFDGAIQNAYVVSLPEQYELDLTGDETIPFTFNIDDIFDLTKRKTAWTKTVTLPGTVNNNKAFGHIYKINGDGLFDPRIRARVILKAKGLTIFDGNLSLDSINKFSGGKCSYNVSMIGDSFELYSRFGEKTIRDLDFSEYDHLFDTEIIVYNWGLVTNGDIDIDTPGVCYNKPLGPPNMEIVTDSYSSPVISGLSSTAYDSVARVGITFNSNHSFSVGDEVHIYSDNNRLNGTHVVADVPASDKITLYMRWDYLTDTSVPDAGSLVKRRTWLGRGYFYPLQDNGTYQKEQTEGSLVQGKLYQFTAVAPGTDDFSNVAKDPLTGAVIPMAVGNTFLADDGITATGGPVNPSIWMGNTRVKYNALPEEEGVLEDKQDTINDWYPTDLIPHIFINEIWEKMVALLDFEISCDVVDTDMFKRLVMPLDQRFNVADNNGAVVHMNEWLPGMKLSDFFNSILNLFNLVILEHKDIKNTISLVSRNTFYDEGTEMSWRLHEGQPLTIKLSNNLLPKYYHLKYKDSTDFYNSQYKLDIGNIANENGVVNDINRSYGDYYQSSGNQFSEKPNVIEVKFEPTVMVGPLVQSPGGNYLNSDKVISVTYHADEDGTNLTRQQVNRFLIAGFRGTDDQWSFTPRNVSSTTFFFYDVTNSLASAGSGFGRFFPYAAHIDNVFDGRAPYIDLNFGSLLGQYFDVNVDYNTTIWDQNSIGGRYWQRHLNSVVSKNAKYITGTFCLSKTDIYKLDFRNPIRPYGTDYVLKLQKVLDWNVNGDGLCKCEFLLKV